MLHVAMTGLNAGDSPAPGVPVIRSIKEHPHWKGKIIALSYDALESGLLDRTIVDAAYLLPYPSSGKESLLERLTSIHIRERIDVIIPNLDSELPNFIALEKDLLKMGIRLFIPTAEQYRKRTKSNLTDFARDAGIRVPKTLLINSPTEVKITAEQLPLVVKGVFYEAYVAYSVEAAYAYINKIGASWGYPILLQSFVDGEEYNAAVVGDGTGRTVGVACMKKLVLTDKRKGWACVSIKNAALTELAEKIVRALKWRGPLEVEAIYSKSEKSFNLIELNPRFPAWIYLAKAAGANLPYQVLQLALGTEMQEPFNSRSGVVFSNYTTNIVTDLSTISSLFTSGEIHYDQVL